MLDCKKEVIGSRNPHILSVIDYGLEIEENEKPYELYYRGPVAHFEEGLGIGLYIAKQIAHAHDGKIVHRCEKVSDFNVPLIEPYLESYSVEKPGEMVDQIMDELTRLKSNDLYYGIVATQESRRQKYMNPTKEELEDTINNPTFKITFEVTIPSKEV